MAQSLIFCPVCGFGVFIKNGAIGRAAKIGAPLYCGRECAGVARRKHKSTEQKRAEKAAYDAARRVELADQLKAAKREYHKRTYDPVKAAVERKAKMPRHVEYCRRPEYRAKKRAYDIRHRAAQDYGPFAEAAMVLRDLETEILSRATRYEIDLQNGKLNKSTRRKRDYAQAIGR